MTRIPFRNEHAQRLRFVGEAGFVGGGRHVFYAVAEIEDESHEVHSVWLSDRNGSAARRVGEELGDLRSPSPSPDGLSLAVLAGVGEARQIWLVSIETNAAVQLTSLPQGVSGPPAWSPDGRSIAFTAGPGQPRDPSQPYRVHRATYRFDGLGYLDDAVQDIYVVDVSTGLVRQLTCDGSMNTRPRWSPDGRSLLYLVSFPPDRPWTFLPELHVLAVESRESHVVVSSWGGVVCAEWYAGGERLVFVGRPTATGHPFSRKDDVWTVGVGGGEPDCRTATLSTGVRSRIQADLPVYEELAMTRLSVDGDVAYVGGQVGGDVVAYRVGLSGPEAVVRDLATDGSAYLRDFDPETGFLYLATSFVEPPELMLGSSRITALNDDLRREVLQPNVRKLTVTASDGVCTDAWALTPTHVEGPWPTVLYIHGGPYGAFGSTYMIDFQLLVGAGFAVVLNNFRGSAGYGSGFSEKIVGNWGPAGSLDHHATVDEAIRTGVADADRVGVCGYSHGGFATCWLVGTSNRFKAAVAENPVTNWGSAFGVVDSESWISLELGGTPHDVPDAYRELSPLTYAPNCNTPLLFVIGESDMRCPPVEPEQYYRVLKSNGVPTEMLRLPKSAHTGTWNGPVAARIAQNEALVDWFNRYLGPRQSEDTSSTMPG